MKTMKLFFAAALLFTIGSFTSCTDETDPIGPSIQFIASSVEGDGVISGNATILVGENFTVKSLLTMGDAKLANFTVRESNTDVTGYPKADVVSGDIDVFLASMAEAGEYTLTFILTDKEGLKDEKSITVTVNEPEPTITVYTDKILGASANNTDGSSFASVDGTIFKLADASSSSNQNKIDFVYFYGATNFATLAAPNDADVTGTVYPSVADWATKNATVFELTSLTPAQFDAIENAADITEPAGNATKVNNLTVGKVIAFKTASTSANPSKKGLIKVTGIVEGNVATGTITIEVKVQK